MLVAPVGTGMDQRESASFQSAVGRRPLQHPRAEKELTKRLHGGNVVDAFVQIAREDK